MAFEIVKEVQESGVEVRYWRIQKVYCDFDTREIQIIFVAYKDEDTRKAGKNFVTMRLLQIGANSALYDYVVRTTMAQIYSNVKLLDNYFDGAVDKAEAVSVVP